MRHGSGPNVARLCAFAFHGLANGVEEAYNGLGRALDSLATVGRTPPAVGPLMMAPNVPRGVVGAH